MRSRQELDESTQCPRCAGSGVSDERYLRGTGYRMSCSFCSGSGLVKPPKMRAECECGVRQPRWTTAHTAKQWMNDHLRSHAPEAPPELGEAS